MALSSSPRARTCAVAALVLVAALPALAQSPVPMMHGMAQGPPALDERIARADAAALATVEAVEPGRIRLRDAGVVFGQVPGSFEVKRRPSAPLPLTVGTRTLLLLEGARSPYVVVDTPEDVPVLADEATAVRRADAVRAVRAATGDVEALRGIYVSFTEGDDETLRTEALRALLRLGGPFLPMPPATAHERARVALDARRPPAVRRAATALAVNDPAALELLLARVAAGEIDGDATLAAAIVHAGLVRTRPSAPKALVAALGSPDAELRLGALALVREAPPEAVKDALAALAANDPDPRVREQAARDLARLRPRGAVANGGAASAP